MFRMFAYVQKQNRLLMTASEIFQKSCYYNADFTINQNKCVQQAVMRFAELDIGCVAVIDDKERFIGLFSERDFIKKVAASGKESAAIQIKEICTKLVDVIVANPHDSLNDCIRKIHGKKIRHLPIIGDNQELQGLISTKDLFAAQIQDNSHSFEQFMTEKMIFTLGKNPYI